MDSSLGFKVISTSRADANMDEEQLSDGASTGFEVQGSRKLLFIYTRPFTQILIKTSRKLLPFLIAQDLPRTSSTISVDTASFHTADGIDSDYPREYILKV